MPLASVLLGDDCALSIEGRGFWTRSGHHHGARDDNVIGVSGLIAGEERGGYESATKVPLLEHRSDRKEGTGPEWSGD
ncbi:MAG TPA: hypothetical protein VN372_05370 [Methanospirillum sp.]|nr:hypothetical protein [Methanospirillum sp.]